MKNYDVAEKEIRKDIAENKLNVVEGWSADELARIYALDSEEEAIEHAQQNCKEPEGPNYFLVGGPYFNGKTAN